MATPILLDGVAFLISDLPVPSSFYAQFLSHGATRMIHLQHKSIYLLCTKIFSDIHYFVTEQYLLISPAQAVLYIQVWAYIFLLPDSVCDQTEQLPLPLTSGRLLSRAAVHFHSPHFNKSLAVLIGYL